MNFSNVKEWTINEGSVIRVTDSLNRVIWEKQQPTPVSNDYFYVEDISGQPNTVSIVSNRAKSPVIEVFYSTDQTNWVSMGTTSTTAITATIPANGKLYLKATANTWGTGTNNNIITASGIHNFCGNIMSLLYDDNFHNQTTFSYQNVFPSLFRNDITLVNAENLVLPATTLATSCYNAMFYGCSALTTAPALPATTLTSSCYSSMFYGCTSLTTAPALPATTLANYCYISMFSGCTSLTTAPTLPATTLAQHCYGSMFNGCTSLTTAPTLPATTLVYSCYQTMFQGCTQLNSLTTYADNISATHCLLNWLDNVASTGNFYNYGSAVYTSDASGIPTGWTEHTS